MDYIKKKSNGLVSGKISDILVLDDVLRQLPAIQLLLLDQSERTVSELFSVRRAGIATTPMPSRSAPLVS